MKRVVLLILMLAGCAETPVLQPGPEIDLPVALHCRHAPLEKPVFPLQSLRRDADAGALLQACLATDRLRQAYELQCEAIVNACE
jgi:hypothetical protein